MPRIHSIALLLLTFFVAGTVSAEAIQVDAGLHMYQRTDGVAGNLNSVGSDTLNNLMTLWAEAFQAKYPNIRIQIEGKGSSTAPPALIEGTSQLGPMSREMKPSEIEAFEQKFGFTPAKIAVAIDALAVYVNKDNPVESMSIQQLDAVFSKTRLCGSVQDIQTWDLLGVKSLAGKPISMYGRNSASGTYGYFKSVALCKGDYKPNVKEQPGSASVVNGIANDLTGIGYSGIGYKTSGVRAVPLSKDVSGTAYAPTYEHAMNGNYPLARPLYVYFVNPPSQPLDKLTSEFFKFVLSKEGQEVVVKDGYLPLPAAFAEQQFQQLQ